MMEVEMIRQRTITRVPKGTKKERQYNGSWQREKTKDLYNSLQTSPDIEIPDDPSTHGNDDHGVAENATESELLENTYGPDPASKATQTLRRVIYKRPRLNPRCSTLGKKFNHAYDVFSSALNKSNEDVCFGEYVDQSFEISDYVVVENATENELPKNTLVPDPASNAPQNLPRVNFKRPRLNPICSTLGKKFNPTYGVFTSAVNKNNDEVVCFGEYVGQSLRNSDHEVVENATESGLPENTFVPDPASNATQKLPRVNFKRPRLNPKCSTLEKKLNPICDVIVSAENKSKDEDVCFGEYVGQCLKNIKDRKTKAWARHDISTILYQAECQRGEFTKLPSPGSNNYPQPNSGSSSTNNSVETSLRNSFSSPQINNNPPRCSLMPMVDYEERELHLMNFPRTSNAQMP